MSGEGKFQKDVIALCKKRNARVVNFSGSQYMEPGIADLRITHRFWKGWCELKGPGGKISRVQAAFLQDHADRGDNAICVWLQKDGTVKVQKYCPDYEVREKICKDVTEFVELLLRRRDQR